MSDVKCPYCGHEQEIDHTDGYGYDEGRTHHQDCGECGKFFTFTTSVIFNYEVEKADCLNGTAEHDYYAPVTYPRECTRMECRVCGEKRRPTEQEMAEIMKPF